MGRRKKQTIYDNEFYMFFSVWAQLSHQHFLCCTTYTDKSILIQLVFRCDAKACAVAASGPGQVDWCLQFVVHLLVDGASKLRPIIALKLIRTKESIVKDVFIWRMENVHVATKGQFSVIAHEINESLHL